MEWKANYKNNQFVNKTFQNKKQKYVYSNI